MDIVREYSVLIVEESTVRRELFEDWLSGIDVKTAATRTELHSEFDPTVVVVCLSHTALESETEPMKKYIFSKNPYCQLVGVLPRSAFVTPHEDKYDEIIQRPVFKETLQSTVESRFVSGVYSVLLRDLYRFNSILVALRRAADDDVTNKEKKIATTESRIKDINASVEDLQKKLPQKTLIETLQTIERHNNYFKVPEKDETKGKSTKHRSQRCPSCKLPWGVDHRNDLGCGFTKLGANVYQCSRCDTLVHGLAEEQQVY